MNMKIKQMKNLKEEVKDYNDIIGNNIIKNYHWYHKNYDTLLCLYLIGMYCYYSCIVSCPFQVQVSQVSTVEVPELEYLIVATKVCTLSQPLMFVNV